jgi:hypothetical protein
MDKKKIIIFTIAGGVVLALTAAYMYFRETSDNADERNYLQIPKCSFPENLFARSSDFNGFDYQ